MVKAVVDTGPHEDLVRVSSVSSLSPRGGEPAGYAARKRGSRQPGIGGPRPDRPASGFAVETAPAGEAGVAMPRGETGTEGDRDPSGLRRGVRSHRRARDQKGGRGPGIRTRGLARSSVTSECAREGQGGDAGVGVEVGPGVAGAVGGRRPRSGRGWSRVGVRRDAGGDEPHPTRITPTTTPSRHPGARSILDVARDDHRSSLATNRRIGQDAARIRRHGPDLHGRAKPRKLPSVRGRSALVHRDGGRFAGPRPDAGRDPRAGGGVSPAIGRTHRAEAG